MRASFNKSNHIDRIFGWMAERDLNGGARTDILNEL